MPSSVPNSFMTVSFSVITYKIILYLFVCCMHDVYL